jgi:hypothetical protein
MAIDTVALRQAALLDSCLLLPDGAIEAEERVILLGQYYGAVVPDPKLTNVTGTVGRSRYAATVGRSRYTGTVEY